MRHINQIGIFWQGEIRAMTKSVQIRGLTKDEPRLSLHSVQEMITSPCQARRSRGRPSPGYFFKVPARKLTVRFQASAASAAR